MTLVAQDERSRRDLAGYLQQSGFDVRARQRVPRRGDAMPSLVWLTDPEGDLADVALAIDGWLAANGSRRAVVVTLRPMVFHTLREVHAGRLVVLPAPVFGWQVVDALRTNDDGDAP